ncbi:right-handed parallel beta-helix repeat-containing protein [Halosimplex aquaticum]|uniref:Right-handed parallel beta-helix repeat-containing protein n=1 Tax=Halosimplex aquaticum TaxID=3026162 RepID=A0ABD5Y3N2_9EURY|nr:right-handed parallel beta-helix repeat-containing protein [Halosimplex aquaticum]
MSRECSREPTRRTFLQTVLCSASAALAGCSFDGGEGERGPTPRAESTPDPAETPSQDPGGPTPTESDPTATPEPVHPMAEEYDRAIDVVEEGVDPTGEIPIRDRLPDLGTDALLFLPEGRYLVDGGWDLSTFDRLALIGDGATLVPRDGYRGTMFYFAEDRETRSVHIEGVTFDFSADETGPRPMNLRATDELFVGDVAVKGSTRGVRFDVTDPDGRGEINRLRLTDGGLPGLNAVGCLVSPKNQGELVFEDCRIAGFPNNGLYASPSNGPVTVDGGQFTNNGIANVRVSGPSTVDGVTVTCDRAPEGFLNMRGIWLRGGRCTVENCEIELRTLTYSDGAVVGVWHGDLRNTDIRVDADEVPAISVKPGDDAGRSHSKVDQGITCTDVTIDGSAAKASTVLVTDYESCSFENISIHQSGANRDGLYLIRSDGAVVRDSVIGVTGQPIRAEDSSVERINVETTTLAPKSGSDSDSTPDASS